MTKKTLQYRYDREGDVMYISVGEPQPAVTVELAEDFILRLHPETKDIIGVTIIDYSRHFSDKPSTENIFSRFTTLREGVGEMAV